MCPYEKENKSLCHISSQFCFAGGFGFWGRSVDACVLEERQRLCLSPLVAGLETLFMECVCVVVSWAVRAAAGPVCVYSGLRSWAVGAGFRSWFNTVCL